MSRRGSRAYPRRRRLLTSPEVDRWETFQRLGEAALARGAVGEACGAFEAACQEAVETGQPGRRALTLGPWVGALVALGRLAEAQVRAQEALDLVVRLKGGSHPDAAVARCNLAQVLEVQGQVGLAEGLLRQGVKTLAASDEPESWRVGLETLGQFLVRQQRYAEALEVWGQLVEALGSGTPEQARALHTLAHLADAVGDPTRGDEARARCLAILEPLWGRTGLPLGELLENMADSLATHGRPGPAAEYYERAWGILDGSFAASHPRMHGLLRRWLACLMEEQRWDQAREVGRRLENDLVKAYGSRHPERGRVLNELGLIEFVQGCAHEACGLFRRALEETVAEEGDARLSLRYNLACALQGAGEFEAALALYEEVLQGEASGSALAERARWNLQELRSQQEG